MSSTKPTRVTIKGITNRAHKQDLKVSDASKKLIATLSDYEKAMKVVDLSGMIARSASRRTIQESHVKMVLGLFEKCNQLESSGNKATLKGVKAYIVGLGMNSSPGARSLIVSTGDEARAKRVAELASEIAQSIGLKTIKDQHVSVVLKTIGYLDGEEVVVEETVTTNPPSPAPVPKKKKTTSTSKRKKTTRKRVKS